MCQAKLEGGVSVRAWEAVSEHVTNLAKEISRQNAEDATWLILVVCAAEERGPEKNGSAFKQDLEETQDPQDSFSGGQRILKVHALNKRSIQGCVWKTPYEDLWKIYGTVSWTLRDKETPGNRKSAVQSGKMSISERIMRGHRAWRKPQYNW